MPKKMWHNLLKGAGTTGYEISGESTATTFHIRGTVTEGTTEIILRINNVNVVISCVNESFDYEYQKPLTSLTGMASHNTTITTIDFSDSCKLVNVTDIGNLLANCTTLTSANLNGITFENVTNAPSMFSNCSSLSSLDFSSATFASLETAQNMFSGCRLLEDLNLPLATFENLTNATNMFNYCLKLVNVTFAEESTISLSMSFANSILTYDSMLSIVNSLASVATTQTLTLNSTAWSALTTAQQNTLTATATAKNWTIAH